MMLLAAGCFLLGALAGALWFHGVPDRSNSSLESGSKSQASSTLSDSTKTILSHLNSPMEIRYYALLEPSVSESFRSFAGRVDQLLNSYQEASAGKLKIRRYDSQAYSNAGAATADGIKPFNSENGNPSFLGLAVARAAQKQTLPQLWPEWEVALEADLSRAIAQVSEASAGVTPPAGLQVAPAAAEQVKHLLPNYESLSLEEGTRILRETALKEFKDAVEKQNQLQKEEQALLAQTSGSAAEQQAAIKRLQQLQSEQTERLKQIPLDAHSQIEALRRLKAATP